MPFESKPIAVAVQVDHALGKPGGLRICLEALDDASSTDAMIDVMTPKVAPSSRMDLLAGWHSESIAPHGRRRCRLQSVPDFICKLLGEIGKPTPWTLGAEESSRRKLETDCRH